MQMYIQYLFALTCLDNEVKSVKILILFYIGLW